LDRNWLNHYPPGVPADIDPDAYPSLKEAIEEAFSSYRTLPAFTNMGATLTYAQLDALSRAFAAWLQHKSGLVRGDRVALMMPNILQYPDRAVRHVARRDGGGQHQSLVHAARTLSIN